MLKHKTMAVIVFTASMFTIVKCFYIRDELMEPIDIARAEDNNINNHNVKHLIQERIKRKVLKLGGIAQQVGVRSRDQTVIIVPNGDTTAYKSVPYSPYDSSKATSVVVSQTSGYSNLPRGVEILPANNDERRRNHKFGINQEPKAILFHYQFQHLTFCSISNEDYINVLKLILKVPFRDDNAIDGNNNLIFKKEVHFHEANQNEMTGFVILSKVQS